MYLLEEIFKKHKHLYSVNFNLRMQRGLSWLRKAKELDDDADLRFVSLWIAFNAIYVENLQDVFDEDQQHLRQFLLRLYQLDQEHRIEHCVWERCSQAITDWSNNPYVYQKLWDFQNQNIDEQSWKVHFQADQQRVQHAVAHRNTVELLLIIFDRLFTLHNQVMHGGSTCNSVLMRKHLNTASQILMTLLSRFMLVLLEHGQALDWKKPFYPVIQVC